VAVTRDGQRGLKLICGQLAESAKRRPAGKRAHDDQLGRGRRRAGQREYVEELELVVQVVLEPQNHMLPVPQRVQELPVASLQ
jgi:hypothetical protein